MGALESLGRFFQKKDAVYFHIPLLLLLPPKCKYLFPYYVILIDYACDIYYVCVYTAAKNHIELGFC